MNKPVVVSGPVGIQLAAAAAAAEAGAIPVVGPGRVAIFSLALTVVIDVAEAVI
ncbi:MAG TPA: hypothetical protein VK395_38025 [Gemmataceae bacterium]|nr:hypothetical protein [Gemmataceae bacterium]